MISQVVILIYRSQVDRKGPTPYVSLYESLKFGNYSSASVAEGLRDVYVPVSFVYGEDDTLIPKDAGLTYMKNPSKC